MSRYEPPSVQLFEVDLSLSLQVKQLLFSSNVYLFFLYTQDVQIKRGIANYVIVKKFLLTVTECPL